MELVNRWLWIVLTIVVIILLVHPNSNAGNVIGALGNEAVANIKGLQGNAPSVSAPRGY